MYICKFRKIKLLRVSLLFYDHTWTVIKSSTQICVSTNVQKIEIHIKMYVHRYSHVYPISETKMCIKYSRCVPNLQEKHVYTKVLRASTNSRKSSSTWFI